jgi:hypothetical protein
MLNFSYWGSNIIIFSAIFINFSLLLVLIICIRIFGLKNFSLASSLTIHLPILMLHFNYSIWKQFLHIFKFYLRVLPSNKLFYMFKANTSCINFLILGVLN